MPSSIKSSRDYRSNLPLGDQRELDSGFSENVLFAAEALSKGFRIRAIEGVPALRESARQLCATFDALRFVLRERALMGQRSDHLVAMMEIFREFDVSWSEFEHSLCFCYFAIAAHVSYDGQSDLRFRPDTFNNAANGRDSDNLTVLLSETILHGLSCRYFSREDIEACEPYLMFAIPRLAIVVSIVHMPDFLSGQEHLMARWMPRVASKKLINRLMTSIAYRLSQLEMEQVCKLEKMLVNSGHDTHSRNSSRESLGCSVATRISTDATCNDTVVQDLFTDICSAADGIQTGLKAREFTKLIGTVFKMHFRSQSANEVKTVPKIVVEPQAADNNESYFRRLGNHLPFLRL